MKMYDELKIAGNLICPIRSAKKSGHALSTPGTATKNSELYEIEPLVHRCLLDQSFRQLWDERYLINMPSLKKLILYDKNSFGYQYAAHMLQNNLSPNLFSIMTPDTPTKYISLITRQTHDLWHVATGYDTSISGETALQSFYTAQTGSTASSALVANGILHSTQLGVLDMQPLFAQMSEAFERGQNSKFLLGVRWDQYLDMPLTKVQSELGL